MDATGSLYPGSFASWCVFVITVLCSLTELWGILIRTPTPNDQPLDGPFHVGPEVGSSEESDEVPLVLVVSAPKVVGEISSFQFQNQ